MDLQPSADSDESLNAMTKKYLSINQEAGEGKSLSNLTAKYKKPRNTNIYRSETSFHKPSARSDVVLDEHSRLEKPSQGTDLDVNCQYSSGGEFSNTEFQGLSPRAVAAKHKIVKIKGNTSNTIANPEETISVKKPSPFVVQNKFSDDDTSSDSEGSSLLALSSKYRSVQASNTNKNDLKACEKPENESGNGDVLKSGAFSSALKELSSSQTKTSSLKGNQFWKSNENDINCSVSQSNVEDLTSKFITAHFSDDSDSDESCTLTGLLLKHTKILPLAESGSAEDVTQSKPRELLAVVNSHRQHTKSESDSFASTGQMKTGNLMKKGFESETTSSLSSLKGFVPSDREFQFSLGCSIPRSFKSNIANSFTSSLSSVRIPASNINTNNSYSDPDISFNARKHGEKVEIHPTGIVDETFGGINLSCAIKTSSSTRVSESIISEDSVDILDEPQDEEIVTLLDNLSVDEDMLEEELNEIKICSFGDKVEENCTYDASHILKEKLKLRTKKCSSFGKVLGKWWRPLQMPYIREEKLQNTIIPFNFSTLSPDDLMAAFRKRRE